MARTESLDIGDVKVLVTHEGLGEVAGLGTLVVARVAISAGSVKWEMITYHEFSGDLKKDLLLIGLGVLRDLCNARNDPDALEKDLWGRAAGNPDEKIKKATRKAIDDLVKAAEEFGPLLDEACADIRRAKKPGMGNGRWRPSAARLSELLPAEAIKSLVPVMSRIERGDADYIDAQGEVLEIIGPHRKRLDELQIDPRRLAFKLASFARKPFEGPLGNVTMDEIESHSG